MTTVRSDDMGQTSGTRAHPMDDVGGPAGCPLGLPGLPWEVTPGDGVDLRVERLPDLESVAHGEPERLQEEAVGDLLVEGPGLRDEDRGAAARP